MKSARQFSLVLVTAPDLKVARRLARAALKAYLQKLNEPNQPNEEQFTNLIATERPRFALEAKKAGLEPQ